MRRAERKKSGPADAGPLLLGAVVLLPPMAIWLAPGRGVAVRHLFPVHHVPPRFDIVRSPVLVLEVVGVLPNVEAEDRGPALGDRAILVGGVLDPELATPLDAEPCPAAAEATSGGRGDLGFESPKVFERLRDRVGQLPARLTAPFGGHDGPKERMIGVAASVVAD